MIKSKKQSTFHNSMKARGHVQTAVWVPLMDKEKIRELAKKLREKHESKSTTQ